MSSETHSLGVGETEPACVREPVVCEPVKNPIDAQHRHLAIETNMNGIVDNETDCMWIYS